MALYDNLFAPVAVGPVTIPNRIVRSAHSTLMGGEALIAYHEARARGGVGMSTLEASSVHPGSPTELPLHDDAIVGFYERICPRVQRHGMKLFQQLYHPGSAGQGASVWSASAIPNPLVQTVPVPMTQAMIDEVVACFAAATRRCREGGIDGIDIHASSGYLLHEFLSPALNRRTDGYGGSRENRLRLLREVIAAVRSEAGGMAVGVRLPNEDHVPGGLDADENAAIAELVEPLVDYVSLHMGAYWRFHTLIAPSDAPLGNEMAANRVVARRLRKPVIVVGRIMTLDHASAIVAAGEAAMVSMVRALIADPELVNKARRLETARIRPCIGTNIGCVGQLMSRGVMRCVVNVAAAQEDRIGFEPERAARPRKVLVIGGGPAGMEAARTAALRGHRVELHEATRHLGGQVRLAALAPHRADVGALTHWLAGELETLGVEVHLESMLDADGARAIGADEIIVATGATPRRDGMLLARPGVAVPGHDLSHVLDVWELFGVGRRARIAGPALVFDDTGTFDAISAADVLLAAGVGVTLVSRLEKLGENLPYPPVTVGAARERLMQGGVDFIGGHSLLAIDAEGVEIGVPFTTRRRRLAARTVVLAGYNEPNRDIADALAQCGVTAHLIGDATGHNGIMHAVRTAAAVARAL